MSNVCLAAAHRRRRVLVTSYSASYTARFLVKHLLWTAVRAADMFSKIHERRIHTTTRINSRHSTIDPVVFQPWPDLVSMVWALYCIHVLSRRLFLLRGHRAFPKDEHCGSGRSTASPWLANRYVYTLAAERDRHFESRCSPLHFITSSSFQPDVDKYRGPPQNRTGLHHSGEFDNLNPRHNHGTIAQRHSSGSCIEERRSTSPGSGRYESPCCEA